MNNKHPSNLDPIAVQLSEAARILNIAPSTLLELAKRNEVPHKKVGKRVILFPLEGLVMWLKNPATDPFQDGSEAA